MRPLGDHNMLHEAKSLGTFTQKTDKLATLCTPGENRKKKINTEERKGWWPRCITEERGALGPTRCSNWENEASGRHLA